MVTAHWDLIKAPNFLFMECASLASSLTSTNSTAAGSSWYSAAFVSEEVLVDDNASFLPFRQGDTLGCALLEVHGKVCKTHVGVALLVSARVIVMAKRAKYQ